MNSSDLVAALRYAVGAHHVLTDKEDKIFYEQDGSNFQVLPQIVVVPPTAIAAFKTFRRITFFVSDNSTHVSSDIVSLLLKSRVVSSYYSYLCPVYLGATSSAAAGKARSS
jgi:hypothetical protein